MQKSSSTAGRQWSASRSLRKTSVLTASFERFTQFLSLLLCGSVVSSVWIQVTAATITLIWDPSPGASGYRVYRSLGSGSFELTQQPLSTNATVEVSTNQVSRIYVTAFNDAGESGPGNPILTNTVFIPPPPTDPPTVPMAPTIISLNRITGTRVDVGVATKDLTSVTQMWKSTDGQAWRLAATLQPAVLWWSDIDAKKNRSNRYRATSCNRFGCSPLSNIAETSSHL